VSTFASTLPTVPLIRADLLKLRRRRGLVVIASLLTVGAVVVTYGLIEMFHLVNPARYGPAGGIENLGNGTNVVLGLGAVAAIIVGSVAGVGDLQAGVYRNLVVTGRSRLALYAARIPGGLAFLLPLVTTAFIFAAVASVVLAGSREVPDLQLIVKTGLWALLQVAFLYLLAVGVSCAVGSRAYTIGIVLAWQLAVSPIVMSISALGIFRELVPSAAIQELAPAGLGDTVRGGPVVPMSLAAVAAVLVVWPLVVLAIGAWRDTTRDA
jgi:ABC-type transport system involved in multi-copper enzyme maturation permease subunit